MKISVNWLREYTDIDISIDELAAKIGSQLGEVEETVDLGKKYEGIVIVKVISCEKHPNADKLSVCMIDNGEKKVQIVCGAPNVREGMLAVWIPPGNTVPATFDKDPFVLESREIRGEVSNGMLASASELAIGDDHSGIVELDHGKPGGDFAKTLGLDDYIIDIENKMFTHRPDCFGILGVAREVAGIQGKSFISPDWYIKVPKFQQKSALPVTIQSKVTKLAPRFMAVAMSSVDVKPSPLPLQVRLAAVGIRPINNIVDVTNYIMYLTGQPLHAYDYDKLIKVSGKASLETRLSRKGDKLKLLGGKEIEFDDDSTILITSDDVPIGIGGVMGGADTEVDETTKNIVLECANFDMYSIRRTSMKYGLFTDAVTRFSKGQSSLQNNRVIAKAMECITEFSGAQQASDVIDSIHVDEQIFERDSVHENVRVSADFINQRLGLSLDVEGITKLIRNVEFVSEITRGDVLLVKAPFWRTDIEISEDIVEEVGRLYGYDNLPLELPKRTSAPAKISDSLQLKQELLLELSAIGANEVLTYSFVNEKLLKAADQDASLAFKISNALSPDLQYYRLSLTPSLLAQIHPNIKAGFDNFALFEFGKVHGKSEIDEKGLPKELERLAVVFADKKKRQAAAYYQALSILRQILTKRFSGLIFIDLKDSPIKDHKMFDAMLAPFDENRSALVYDHDKLLGVIGEYKQSVITDFKLPIHTSGFELFLTPLINQKLPGYQELSRYPSISQDITLRSEHKLEYAKIAAAFSSSLNKNLPDDVINNFECIDIFAKDETHKNITFRVTATSYQRTLTTEMLSSALDKVAAELKDSINATRV